MFLMQPFQVERIIEMSVSLSTLVSAVIEQWNVTVTGRDGGHKQWSICCQDCRWPGRGRSRRGSWSGRMKYHLRVNNPEFCLSFDLFLAVVVRVELYFVAVFYQFRCFSSSHACDCLHAKESEVQLPGSCCLVFSDSWLVWYFTVFFHQWVWFNCP